MKLTTIILISTLLQVSAASFGQKLTLSGKNITIEQVFRAISNQTGYDVVVFTAKFKTGKKIDVNFQNTSLDDVMAQLIKGQGLAFTIEDKTVVIKEKQPSFLEKLAGAFTPPIDVRGRVVDEKGQALPGASVKVKNSKQMAVTDVNGSFYLQGVPEDAILVITYIGYNTKEIKAGSNLGLINLEANISQLDETIVKGYYTTTKRLNTGNVSKVDAATIEKQPVSNPLQALIGRMPGVQITQQTGVAGGNFTVQIRGINSINSGNEPLYLIDGIPFTSTSLSSNFISSGITKGGNPLNSINPADIESIEVLKDADATAIYGSRGANGVVLISTKKGKAGATKVNVDFSSGIGRVAHQMDLLNTQQYLQMRHEAFKNDNETPDIYTSPDLLTWDTTRYTNWQKELIGKTSHYTDAQVSLSGGNTNTQYVVGGGYHKETSVFPGDFAYDRLSGHLNLTHTSTNQKFRASFSSIYSVDNNDLPRGDLTSSALSLSPNAPALYDESGNLNWEGSTWYNPLAGLKMSYNAKIDNLILNTSLSYNFTPELQLKTNMGYTKMEMKEFVPIPLTANDPIYWPDLTGSAQFNKNSINTWIIEPQLNWNKKLGNGKIDILAGATFQQNITDGQTFQASGYTSDALLENIAAASRVIPAANYTQYRYTAVFARANYNLNEKYILNLTARRDGSSRFGAENQFANFGAIGAAWIFSKENFFQNNLPFISFGKIRSSYGTTGNDQIQDYQYLDTYSPTQFPYQGMSGVMPNRLLNPEYAWEVNKKIEAALDLGFLNDRILFSASYYQNRSSNQLLPLLLPWITGFGGLLRNQAATVQNTGIELELNTINFNSKTFKWSTGFNLTIPRNKLVSYPDLEKSPDFNIYEIGKSLNIFKAIHFTGVNPQTGVYEFEDVNGDGEIAPPQDNTSLKSISQEFYGALLNKAEYKNFQLDVFFQFVKQTGRNYMLGAATMPGMMGNQPTAVLNRWQKPGDITSIQQYSQSYSSPAYMGYIFNSLYPSDNTVSDASFIRLKNVSLSYNLPLKWMEKAHLQSCRIFVQGQNLFTITNFLGLDPESNAYGTYLPPLRTVAAGIQLTF